jgi:hypothetical protein
VTFGWSLFSGLVRPVPVVVVPLVLGENLSSVCLVEDQNVVAHFTAEGSDDPFAVVSRVRLCGSGVM